MVEIQISNSEMKFLKSLHIEYQSGCYSIFNIQYQSGEYSIFKCENLSEVTFKFKAKNDFFKIV